MKKKQERHRVILDFSKEVHVAIKLVAAKKGIGMGELISVLVGAYYPAELEEARNVIKERR